MRTTNNRSAFTLVEMVMVIVIIGLLAVVAMPKFADMQSEATSAAEQGTVAAVRSGIKIAHMSNLAKGTDTYPDALGSGKNGSGSEDNPLFDAVIDNGITDSKWEKLSKSKYKYAPTDTTYEYDNKAGTFKPTK